MKFLDEKIIDESFLHRIIRKVRNDRTIKIDNIFYEVPFKYVGKEIEIRYNPDDLTEIFVFENNKKGEKCDKVDKISNSKVKRKNNIDYSKVINDERNIIELEGD